jgi:UPF0271 protein
MPSSSDRLIDLNADVGEGPGEEPLYSQITSANVACGGHAGDEATMRDAIRLALRHGVAIGAHPSYPDRQGFGRVTRNLSQESLSNAIAAQVTALVQAATAEGALVTHVKPHGALYADASRREVGLAVALGVASVSPALVLVGLAGSTALRVYRDMGFRVVAEGFADRAYGEDGTLVPRTHASALITDPEAAAHQAIRLASAGVCDTICVHGDTRGAAAIATAVRRGLTDAGFVISSLARPGSGT